MTKAYRFKAGDPWRVVPFMFLGAILQAGLAIGISAADSLFISHVGADRLPVIYACMPVIMLAYIAGYTRLLNRWGIDRLFVVTIGVLVVGGVAFAVLLRGEHTSLPVYFAAKFYGSLWYIALYSLLWNFIDGFFDLSEAKRLFGLIAGGSAVGAIGGGFVVTHLSEIIGVAGLFGIWAGSVLFALPVHRWIVHHVPRVAGEDAGEEEEGESSLADTLRNIIGSRYVTAFTLVIFLTLITATLCEFRYYSIFEKHYPDEAALAALFGKLYAGVNVFNLVVTLILFRTLVRWVGVRNVALIQPVIYLGVFGFLLMDGGMVAALFGFVAYQGVMTSIDYNNQNLLFSVLPEKGKERTRTFIEGICEPLATASAGVLLLGAQYFLSDTGISGIGFGTALACLVLALVLRVEFLKSMTANVRRSWLDFSGAGKDVAFVQKEDEVFLRTRADDQAAPEHERLAALERLWQLQPIETVERVLAWLPAMSLESRRAVRGLLREILLTDDPAIVDRCLSWAEQYGADCDAYVLEHFGRRRLVPLGVGRRRVQMADPRDRAAGAIVLWESNDVSDVQIALKTIDRLLDGEPTEAEAGWHALGVLGEMRFIPRILPHLRDTNPHLRLRAIEVLLQLTGPESSRVQPELLQLISTSRRPEERLLVIGALARINDSAIIEPLLKSIGDMVPQERRELEHLLIGFGPRAVPASIKVLRGTTYSLASRSIAARALARVAFPQLELMVPELIEDIVRRAYRVVAFRHILRQHADRGPGTAALALVYHDLPRLMLELVLELLSVIGRLSSYDSIVAALRAENGRERGYALESIEQACGRQLFERLFPILDEQSDEDIIAKGEKFGVRTDGSLDTIVQRSRKAVFPLEASAALQAAVEAEPHRARDICLETLQEQSHPMVRGTARVLMRRTDANASPTSTVVERVRELSRHAFFRNWGVRSLEAVGLQLEECWHEPGEVVVDTGQRMARFGVAMEGGFRSMNDEGQIRDLPAPSDFGRESLGELWSAQRRTVTVTKRARIMWLPAHALRASVQAQPRLAIELLVWKLSNP
ncbi:Npt1/Npt2 family nucleotide transporter [Synoicihabitans lomoniglobus]|uniref:ADP,ATP carrier protein n=1 Tax=Synoicihabitans lomoniglobus TaxID=2909285 RepID=A0AAE9ZYQ6_9BACT|nr:hypothetical protein [Opitutaceae bacterium LMO-M01]WED65699.1 Npt1/Npt2 family nucleotide transporter [Opitutaceae bacterium LMO-M01]